jgi:thiol-disulfide isomerase/thioredoxin
MRSWRRASLAEAERRQATAITPSPNCSCQAAGSILRTPFRDSYGSQPWAPRFERHLRAILKVNQDRAVRCRAQFALASVVQNAPADRQEEAEALFEQYCAEFDGKYVYSFQRVEEMLNGLAQTQLNELRFRAVGRPVPDITGNDLDGRPLKLRDYRGRVVLVNFWATWCFPCMKLIPHERELVARFQGEPFEIVGVNCDPAHDPLVHVHERKDADPP